MIQRYKIVQACIFKKTLTFFELYTHQKFASFTNHVISLTTVSSLTNKKIVYKKKKK